jgi:hypothetical protein
MFEEWTSVELLESIHQSIDWLHRLSNSVRKASAVNQNARAVGFKLEDYNGANPKSQLSETYVRTIFENNIQEINNGLDRIWVDRLIDTMVTRLRRILYRRSRQARWSFPEIALPTMEQEKPKPLQLPMLSVPKAQPKATPRLDPELGHTDGLGPLPTSRVTDLSSNRWRRDAGRSKISKATSAPLKQEDESAIPAPPREAITGKSFTCPYCCLILPSSTAQNRKAWT